MRFILRHRAVNLFCTVWLLTSNASDLIAEGKYSFDLDVPAGRFSYWKIEKWTREKEEGKAVYDIEFTQVGKKFEADIFADGAIHNWEQQVAASDLPAAVVQTVGRQFPKAGMKEIMAVTAVTNGNERLRGIRDRGAAFTQAGRGDDRRARRQSPGGATKREMIPAAPYGRAANHERPPVSLSVRRTN